MAWPSVPLSSNVLIPSEHDALPEKSSTREKLDRSVSPRDRERQSSPRVDRHDKDRTSESRPLTSRSGMKDSTSGRNIHSRGKEEKRPASQAIRDKQATNESDEATTASQTNRDGEESQSEKSETLAKAPNTDRSERERERSERQQERQDRKEGEMLSRLASPRKTTKDSEEKEHDSVFDSSQRQSRSRIKDKEAREHTHVRKPSHPIDMDDLIDGEKYAIPRSI